ncbi:hypothetical protein BC938DRAFT_472870, partial [Jimgerdemannia flammicorona]
GGQSANRTEEWTCFSWSHLQRSALTTWCAQLVSARRILGGNPTEVMMPGGGILWDGFKASGVKVGAKRGYDGFPSLFGAMYLLQKRLGSMLQKRLKRIGNVQYQHVSKEFNSNIL